MGLNHALWDSRYWLAGLHALFLVALWAAFLVLVSVSYVFVLNEPGTPEKIWHTAVTYWYVPFLCIAALWMVSIGLLMQPSLDLTRSDSADALGMQKLQNRLESLCMARNLPVPKLYIMDYPSINAILWGLKEYRIYITRQACETLPQEDLDAMMAQQLGHLHHGDNYIFPLMELFITMGNQIAFWALAGLVLMVAQSPQVLIGPAIMPIGLVAISFGGCWLAFRSYGMWYSHVRRFTADLFAVQLSQNANALIDAIERAKGKARTPILTEESRTLAFLDADPALTPPWYVDPDQRIADLRETLGMSTFGER